MNFFSNMEINDLLDNRFRLEDKHTPNYLAECFQRLFPTLGRMGLSTVIDEMARANHRCFGAKDGDMPSGAGMRHCEANSSKLPIRGETLDLNFFFELWKREFRFEGGIYDKFTFGDELRLAFRINPREFWEVLVRADRDMGTYLKDCFELFQYRELPQEISFTLRAGGGSLDYKDASRIRELLPRTNGSLGKMEDIAKACISIWGMPKFFDERRLVEELCRENNIRRAGISSSMTREPYVPFPLKNIANLRVDFLKRAAEDRFREDRKMEELSSKEFKIQEIEVPTNSLPPLSQQELLLRGDYRGHGDPVEPAPAYFGSQQASKDALDLIKKEEGFIPYFYNDKDKSTPKKRVTRENKRLISGTLTIGFGFTLDTFPELEKYFDKDMTRAEAESFLPIVIEKKYALSVQELAKTTPLTQGQFDALVSISYNRGENFLSETHTKGSQLVRLIKERKMKAAADFIRTEIDNTNRLKELPGLRRRRVAEAELFEKIN